MDYFISEIQTHDVIWNKCNPRHKDRVAIENEWEKISHKTGFSKDDAKKKWRNMRDTFLKEFKKIPKGIVCDDNQDLAALYNGKWQHFTSLLFLKDTLNPRVTEGTFPSVESADNTKFPSNERSFKFDEDLEEASADSNADNSNCVEVSESHHQISETDPKLKPLKRKRDYFENYLERRLLDIETKKLKEVPEQTDENSLFLQSLAPYFRKLNAIQQLRVRNKFQDILLEELSQLKRNN